MKKMLLSTTAIIGLTFMACNGNADTGNSADSSKGSSAVVTMPVLHPDNFGSSGTIKTPPVNDDNVIIPDTSKAVK